MNNIQRLTANGNKNHRIFAMTVIDLMHSQGFYGRLYRSVNEMGDDCYEQLYELIGKQDFKDPLDVVLWLEQKTGGNHETPLLSQQPSRSPDFQLQR